MFKLKVKKVRKKAGPTSKNGKMILMNQNTVTAANLHMDRW